VKLILKENAVRKATEADAEADVVDTATLSVIDLQAVFNRVTTENNWDLNEELDKEHPNAFPDEFFAEQEEAARLDAEARGERPATPRPDSDSEDDVWDPAGVVTVKEIYPEDSPYHGMPGLEAPADAFLATMERDLATMGIAPATAVSFVRMFRPLAPNTHDEVGAFIGDVYAKFHLTDSGYGLIYNATQPPVGVGQYYGQYVEFATPSVTAGDLYGTFLQMATERVYDIETYDCEAFAGELCGRLSGQWMT
jgi:hypothetical protein